MKRIFIALVMMGLLYTPALAHEEGELILHDAWVETATANGWISIENTTDEAVTVISLTTPIADSVDLLADDEPVAAVEILPDDALSLAFALRDLEEELPDALSLTLTIEHANGETMEHVVGALVLDEAPAPHDLIFYNSWMRPVFSGMNGAIYLHIANHGDSDDQLVAFESPAASHFEIHQSLMQDNVMTMHPVETLELHSGEHLDFEAEGLHLMLIDMQADWQPGTALVLTLTFESGAEITLAVPVKLEAETPAHHH